eukprot:s2260_g7.t1
MVVPCAHWWVLSPQLLPQDAFIKTCRKKVERITEDDLFVDGEFMSEQDMIDDNYKENLVNLRDKYEKNVKLYWVLEEDEDMSEDGAIKAKSAFDGDLLPSDWVLPKDTTGAFE